jgi:hypothetical protein
VEALAEESEHQIGFYNMEAGPNLEFLAELGISGLPTFLFYKNGALRDSLAGTNILMDEIAVETKSLLEDRDVSD